MALCKLQQFSGCVFCYFIRLPNLRVRNCSNIKIFKESIIDRGRSRTAGTSKMELFVIIVTGWKPLTIVKKSSILNVAAVLDPPLIDTWYGSKLHKRQKVSIVLLSFSIVIRIGKIIWKHRPYRWYFCLNVKYLGGPCGSLIKTVKNGDFCEKLHSKNDFENVLGTFCCYAYGAKVSEAFRSSEDCYRSKRVSHMLLVCYNLLNSQNIPISQ